jgi:hypothetical protein
MTYFTVTIDTEEDNWGELEGPFAVRNIDRIPRLQDLFSRFDVRPTYLISYPVATSPTGVNLLGRYHEQRACEIGTHPHPWNTPPLEERRTQANTFICNLPAPLQFEKIKTLTETIAANFGVRPTSYRSGRWGFSDDVAKNLITLGYAVDTSVFPEFDWGPDGPDYRGWTNEPYVYRTDLGLGASRTLLEVPASVGFLQGSSMLSRSAFHGFRRLPFGPKVLAGLGRMGVLNYVCLSPEINDAPQMIRLATRFVERGAPVINMFFHSPSLLEGRTPFVRTAADLDAFIARIESFLTFARSSGLRPVTMSELTPGRLGASRTRTLAIPKSGAA